MSSINASKMQYAEIAKNQMSFEVHLLLEIDLWNK